MTGYAVASGGYVFIPVSTPFGNGWVASQYVTAIGTMTPTRTPTVTRTPTIPGAATNTPTRTPTRTATVSGGIPFGSTVRATTRVNMRSGAGTSFGVVNVLPTNTTGTVLAGPVNASGYSWYQISTASLGTGWVASSYLAVVSGPVATATRTPTTPSGFPVNSTVRTTDYVNLRSGGGTGFTVVALLLPNASCTVMSGPTSNNGYQWYRLNCPSYGIGYGAGDFFVQVSAASVSEEPSSTATTIPATATVGVETPVETPPVTETATTEATEAVPADTETPVTEPQTQGEVQASPEISVATEEVPATEIPAATEIPPTEAAPQSLPIARVQRTDGSSPAQVLVDNDPSTVWMTDGSSVLPLAAFVVDLDAAQYVSSISWLSGADGLAGTLHISVSTDNETWTDLAIDSIGPPGEWQQLAVGANVRFIRFVFVNEDGLAVLGGIAEVKVWP